MKVKLIVFTLLSIFISSVLKAQEVEDNIRMVKPFKADGITNEWKEPLDEYNFDTKLAFALANDDKQLYILIESLDPQTTFSILRGGITLNINTEGKKKQDINLTFPLIEHAEHSNGERPAHNSEGERATTELEPKVYSTAGVKVSGFKNIKDGYLTTQDNGGIETGMVIKPNRDLIYELSIPLSQLQVTLDMKKPLVYNIKINETGKGSFKKENGAEGNRHSGGGGMSGGGRGMGGGGRGMGGGRSGGMGGGAGGNARSQQFNESANKVSDFWIKFKLVKS